MFRFCKTGPVFRPSRTASVKNCQRFQSEAKDSSTPVEVKTRPRQVRTMDWPFRPMMFEPFKMFSDFDAMRRNFFKDDVFFNPSSGFAELEKFSSPKADIYESEKKDAYIVELEMPGTQKEDVKIDLENDILTVSAERKSEKVEENKEKNYYRKEISSGSFKRQFSLPEHISAQGVKASMEHGVLKITLPKSEKSSPVKINID